MNGRGPRESCDEVGGREVKGLRGRTESQPLLPAELHRAQIQMEMDMHPKARFNDRVEYRQLEIQNHEINIDAGISNKPQYATARKMQRNVSNATLGPNTGMPNADLYNPAEHTSGHRRIFGDRSPSYVH